MHKPYIHDRDARAYDIAYSLLSAWGWALDTDIVNYGFLLIYGDELIPDYWGDWILTLYGVYSDSFKYDLYVLHKELGYLRTGCVEYGDGMKLCGVYMLSQAPPRPKEIIVSKYLFKKNNLGKEVWALLDQNPELKLRLR